MNLKNLNVSLTKHGAHKIALLLKRHAASQVLKHVYGTHPGIDIDAGQARKNLSVDSSGKVPQLWERAKDLGSSAIEALVLLAIIFSHHEAMRAMAVARTGSFRGTLVRGAVLDGKAFTNLKHTLHELGFSPIPATDKADYNLKPLFEIQGVGPLALELLTLKLKAAGWNGATAAVDEMVAHNFHRSLSISESQFRAWLGAGAVRSELGDKQDVDFFTGADESPTRPFKFKAGHARRKTGSVSRHASPEEQQAELLHNEIQTAFHKSLVKKYGEGAVGTEVKTGLGTSVDVVVEHADHFVFYEIKVAPTLRACIRQALPQLMEYAYWRCRDDLARKLVIVGTFPLTNEVRDYLQFLRKRFDIPVWYKRFILKRHS